MTIADDDAEAADGAVAPGTAPATKPVNPRPAAPSDQQAGDVHTYIGARLRKAFDDIASQPVPDRFLQLMQELDKT